MMAVLFAFNLTQIIVPKPRLFCKLRGGHSLLNAIFFNIFSNDIIKGFTVKVGALHAITLIKYTRERPKCMCAVGRYTPLKNT
mgnify:CR=1 FL=1